jgi:hypothetical protein
MKFAASRKLLNVFDVTSYLACGFFVNFLFWVIQNSDSVERDDLGTISFEYWRGFVFAIPFVVSYFIIYFSAAKGKNMSFDKLAIVSIIGTLVWIVGFSIGFFLKYGRVSDTSSNKLEIVMFLFICMFTFITSLGFRAIASFVSFVNNLLRAEVQNQ